MRGFFMLINKATNIFLDKIFLMKTNELIQLQNVHPNCFQWLPLIENSGCAYTNMPAVKLFFSMNETDSNIRLCNKLLT